MSYYVCFVQVYLACMQHDADLLMFFKNVDLGSTLCGWCSVCQKCQTGCVSIWFALYFCLLVYRQSFFPQK